MGTTATSMPPCQASPAARPCWEIQDDPVACALAPDPHAMLVVQRAIAPAPATVTRMRCLVPR